MVHPGLREIGRKSFNWGGVETVLQMVMHGFMVMWMSCHWLMPASSQPIQSYGAMESLESKPVRFPMDWRDGTGWVGALQFPHSDAETCSFGLASHEGKWTGKNPKGPAHASMRSHPSCQKAWQLQEVHVCFCFSCKCINLHKYTQTLHCIYIYILYTYVH